MKDTRKTVDLENVRVNLGLILRGDLQVLKRFAGLLDKHQKEMDFKVLFIKASGDRLFVTKERPPDVEERK